LFHREAKPQGCGALSRQVSFFFYLKYAQSKKKQSPFFDLPETLDMAQASASANRILSLRSSRPEAEMSGEKLEKGEGGIEIEFKNVHFKYPTRDMEVFSGLDMKVRWLRS
jgi:ABC-type transport system involved in cytochrome bd biosynthesis fused ATPase/permease subunit